MLQDLRAMLLDYYSIDENTDTGQRELNKLMNVYSHDLKQYRDLCSTYKQLKAS